MSPLRWKFCRASPLTRRKSKPKPLQYSTPLHDQALPTSDLLSTTLPFVFSCLTNPFIIPLATKTLGFFWLWVLFLKYSSPQYLPTDSALFEFFIPLHHELVNIQTHKHAFNTSLLINPRNMPNKVKNKTKMSTITTITANYREVLSHLPPLHTYLYI